ncbi:3-deoxy-D-manno-octulosonic acid transferase [Candidatus Aminicenantes bacterium AC-335-L06]|nr:3-deoxy-D-manno-octulosonic acid transferase [Candidatus Aminicenantes bacterium AC-335-L06]
MYLIYTIILFFLLLIYFPYFLIKNKFIRKFSINLKYRLGKDIPENKENRLSLWFHAVSVGETLSIQNLISNIKKSHPDWQIYLSTLTPTGFEVANKKIKADNIFFFPLDFPCIIKKYFQKIKPKLLILTESEFWPNLLREAGKSGIKVLVINGRISDSSFKKYYFSRFLFRKVLANVSLFLVQTTRDKEKLEKIGIESDKIIVSGNLKADISIKEFTPQEIEELKYKFGIDNSKKVIVAGSTLKGEEERILNAFIEARKSNENLFLILAPRHPERFNEVEKLVKKYPLKYIRKSCFKKRKKWDIMLLDTLGELVNFYAICNLAFVGGSLVPKGGHNILEPAFFKKPVFFGPHYKNFQDIAEKFLASGGARIVRDEKDLIEAFSRIGTEEYIEMGERAYEIVSSLRGATKITLKYIQKFINL